MNLFSSREDRKQINKWCVLSGNEKQVRNKMCQLTGPGPDVGESEMGVDGRGLWEVIFDEARVLSIWNSSLQAEGTAVQRLFDGGHMTSVRPVWLEQKGWTLLATVRSLYFILPTMVHFRRPV